MYNSGRRGRRASDGYGILSQADRFNQTEYPIPIVNSFAVTTGSYVPLDDTAASTAGGQTIVLYGSGFAPGATVTVGGVTIGAVTYLDQGRLTFTSPANSSGSYTIVVINANGGAGILVPGLVYSGVPTWSTSAGSIGSSYERTNVSSTFVATGDAPMTYSILSGSLPPGTSLSTTGVLSGTAPVESGSTTYSFTIRATDGQLQDTDRSFSLTINTDVVTMSSPTNNQVISSYEYAPISNVTVAGTSAAGFGVVYSANAVPTGITLNANTGVISGTVNTVGNTFTRLTATANSTNRTATRDVVFNVNQDVVTWSTPTADQQYSLSGGSAMSPVSLSATSAAGFGVQYSANALPSGLSISGSTISGTPDTAQTVYTLLTATANTTNRSATRTISWVISLGDLYWKYTTLALNATPTSTPFNMDLSNNNTILTVVGDTKPSNFNPYQQGYYSNYFNGSSTGLTIPGTNGAFAFGTGNFTIEFWAYSTAFSGILCSIASSWSLRMESSGAITWYIGGANGGTTTSTVSLNTWNHFAVVRTGTGTNQFVIYVNGQPGYTNTRSDNITSTNTLYIGVSDAGNSGYYPGHISNFRVIKGTALYTGAFTPSTTPLTAVANTSLLTCQDNRFIDDSPNNLTITRTGVPIVSSAHPFTTPTTVAYNTQYSTFFDGTGDYLTVPNNTALQMSSGDFTIEFWINYNSITGYQTPLSKGYTAAGDIMFQTGNGNGALIVYLSGSAAITESTGAVVGQWYHYALVRSGTTVTLYRDGVSRGTATSSVNFNTTDQLGIGATGKAPAGGSVGQYGVIGCMSNVRVVKGTALYSGSSTTVANFTVPTVPLTAVANTSLLTCQNATLIDNSTNAFTITSAGQAQPIALSPFTMTTANTTITSLGSAYFDGTGDYLTIPASPAMALGSGDFTIEAWIYTPSTVAQFGAIICNVNNPDGFYLSFSTSNFITFSNYGTVAITSSSAVPLNTWTHVAVTRSGTSLRMFFNGVSVGSATNSTVYGVSSATNYIGFNGGAAYYTGYIADCRVIKGTALYTSNFLPPQVPSTPVANTQLLTVQTNGGATNNGFVDQSSFNNIITRAGNTTQGTFSPYSPNGWSVYFNGASTYYFPANSALNLGGGAFTIEGWVNIPTGTSNKQIVNGPILIGTGGYAGSTVGALRYYDGITAVGSSSYLIANDTWNHFAVVREGTGTNQFKMYVNGILVYVGTSTANPANYDLYIGAFNTSTDLLTGYVSNVRWVKGTAVYTTASTTIGTQVFTPPTGPLTAIANTTLLTAQSNRFVDNGPYNFTPTISSAPKIQAFSPFGGITSVPTTYSNYFGGSGDYLSLSSNPVFALSGDYTIEAWVFRTDSGTQRAIVDLRGGSNLNVLFFMNSSNQLVAFNSSSTWISSTGTIPLNQWTHVAICRSGTSVKLFINGVNDGTATNSDANVSVGSPYIGRQNGSTANDWLGNISNVRVVKGQALYTGNFTPATAPLTTSSVGTSGTNVAASLASSNVSLLTCQSTTMIDNSNNNFTITATGSPKVYSYNPFGQTTTTGVGYSPALHSGSMYFDGTGDKLTVANYPTLGFKANDFTIQCWFYTNVASIEQVIMTNGWSSYAPWLIRIDTANTLRLNMSLTGGSWHVNEQSLGTVTPGQWYHVAVTRTSGVLRAFTNGVQTYTVDLSTSALYDASQALTIGGRSDTVVPFNGYLSDAQIINGFSLYRANFVPPVAPATPTYTIGTTRGSSTLLLSGTSGGIIDAHGTSNLETVGDAKLAPEDAYSGSFYSNYSDGNADYLTVPSATWTTLAGTFTIEFWVMWTAPVSSAGSFMGVQSNGGFTFYNDNTRITPNVFGTGNIFNSTFSPSSIVVGKWYHIAVTRNSSNLMTMWVDGVSVGSTTTSSTYTQGAWAIFSPGNVGLLNGYISNHRVTNTCLYTTTFTPSTTPLTAVTGTQLLTCQSNSFKDNSTNNATLTKYNTLAVRSFNPFRQNTGKSILFDGTGDSLYSVSGPNYTFGTGDFTIEFWINFTSTSNRQDILWISTAGAATDRLGITWNLTAGNLTYYISPTVTNAINAAWTPTTGQWYHIALCRSSGNTKLFINGIQSGSTYTDSRNYNSQYALYVGQDSTGLTSMFNGYIEDLRITRGIARYTTNFAPPTTTFEVK